MRIPVFLLEHALNLHAAIGVLLERRWTKNPFGKTPHAPESFYEEKLKLSKSEVFLEADLIEVETGFAIEREALHDFAKYTQIVKKSSDLNYTHGRLLYSNLCRLITDQKFKRINIIETGTARGFSALCMAQAIQDCGIEGTIISLDLTSHCNQQIWNCIEDHAGPKSRQQILSRWPHLVERMVFLQGSSSLLLERIGLTRVHFAFLDAQHTEHSVMREFLAIQKLQQCGDVVFFDDVTPAVFPGVCKAINQIEGLGTYSVKRIKASDQRGYALAHKKSD